MSGAVDGPTPPVAAEPPASADARPDQPPSSQVLWAVVLVIAGMVVPAVGIAIGYRACDAGTSRGQVIVENSPLGSWRHVLLGCTMAPGVLTEVELGRDDGLPVARIFYDRGVPVVELTEPSGNRTLRLDPSMCELKLDPRRPASAPEGLDLGGGSLSAQCKLAPGGTVTIDAWWQRCKPR